MTFAELQAALAQALATSKIGTPVYVRLHLQFPAGQVGDLLSAAVDLCEPIFGGRPARLGAIVSDAAQQCNVLLHYEFGQTLSITAGVGAAKRATIQLLVGGNHGIIRLEGDDLDDIPKEADAERWEAAMRQSSATGEAVQLPLRSATGPT